jgi:hypothetical protein
LHFVIIIGLRSIDVIKEELIYLILVRLMLLDFVIIIGLHSIDVIKEELIYLILVQLMLLDLYYLCKMILNEWKSVIFRFILSL